MTVYFEKPLTLLHLKIHVEPDFADILLLENTTTYNILFMRQRDINLYLYSGMYKPNSHPILCFISLRQKMTYENYIKCAQSIFFALQKLQQRRIVYYINSTALFLL